MLIVGVTGSRLIEERALTVIYPVIDALPLSTTLVAGACIGVDAYAMRRAHQRGLSVLAVLPANRALVMPDWRAYCTMAIHMLAGTSYMDRNDRIIAEIDRLLAFPKTATEELRSGTWATVRRAREKGIPVEIYPLS